MRTESTGRDTEESRQGAKRKEDAVQAYASVKPYCRIAARENVPNSESLQVNSMRRPSVDTVPEQSPLDVSPVWYLALYLLV